MARTNQFTTMMLIKRSIGLLVLGALLAAAISTAQGADRTSIPQGANKEPSADEKLEQKMASKITVNFKDTRLVEVIDHLRKQLGINLIVNWTAFEAVGVEQGALVTFELTDIPAQKVLDLVLEKISGKLQTNSDDSMH